MSAAVRAGALGYCTLESNPDCLMHSVRTVARGGFAALVEDITCKAEDVEQAMGNEGQGVGSEAVLVPEESEEVSAPKLTPREEETLELIALGFTHKEVAIRMGVTTATANTYVERLRTKLQVGNKAELTRAALARSRVTSSG
jgi:DNA-binding NarL/FixJ family response regulator